MNRIKFSGAEAGTRQQPAQMEAGSARVEPRAHEHPQLRQTAIRSGYLIQHATGQFTHHHLLRQHASRLAGGERLPPRPNPGHARIIFIVVGIGGPGIPGHCRHASHTQGAARRGGL